MVTCSRIVTLVLLSAFDSALTTVPRHIYSLCIFLIDIYIVLFPEQLNQQIPATEHQQELNGFIDSSPIYVTSIPSSNNSSATGQYQTKQDTPPRRTAIVPGRGVKTGPLSNGHAITNTSSTEEPDSAAEIELKQDLSEDPVNSVSECSASTKGRATSPFANGRTEVLIGQDSSDVISGAGKLRTTAIVENSSARKLGIGEDNVNR